MTDRLVLRTAFADYPHVMALKSGAPKDEALKNGALADGRISSDRVGFAFETVEPITRAFRRMVRTADFDLCEIALTTLAQAHAYGKPITGLPVVLMRGFHHASLVCPVASPITGPRDLPRRRVGVRAYSQTTGVWLRGILLDAYGVDHRDITWVTQEDAHVREYVDPPNVVRIGPGQDLAAMLLAGEIDAGIALAGLDPARVRPVIPDAAAEAAAWYRGTGAYPVNHVICVKTALLAAHPWLAGELFRLFTAAKLAATEPSAEGRHAPLVGDPLPYGLEPNRTGIALCLRYAAEQGLVPVVCRPEDLFAPV